MSTPAGMGADCRKKLPDFCWIAPGSLVFVTQYFICILNLLEFCIRLLNAMLILVWMPVAHACQPQLYRHMNTDLGVFSYHCRALFLYAERIVASSALCSTCRTSYKQRIARLTAASRVEYNRFDQVRTVSQVYSAATEL